MKKLLLIIIFISFKSFSQENFIPFGVSVCGSEFGTNSLPGVYNVNYIYPNKSEIQYFSKKGVALLQLPFRWERIQKNLNGLLDQTELNRIKQFLNDCDNCGLMVILNMHNFARYKINNVEYIIGSDEVPIESFVNVWKQLTFALKGFNNIYAFDIMNEPHDMGEHSWYNISQNVINGIRELNKEVYIMIEGESYSNSYTWVKNNDKLKNLKDPSNNIIYNAHCYFDEDFSGSYKKNYDESHITEQTGIEYIKPFIDWLKLNNKKGFVGEFGIPKDDQRWLIVFDNFLKYLILNKISGSYWAAGSWWKNYPLSLHPIAGIEIGRAHV